MQDMPNSVGEATEQWRQRMRLEIEGPIEGMKRRGAYRIATDHLTNFIQRIVKCLTR